MISKEMEKRIEEAEQAADDAFWAVIAEKFPEVKTGDFDPLATIFRQQANMADIMKWVEWNYPKNENAEEP